MTEEARNLVQFIDEVIDRDAVTPDQRGRLALLRKRLEQVAQSGSWPAPNETEQAG
jgi:hypothetical protein